jgi:hypothetical protein
MGPLLTPCATACRDSVGRLGITSVHSYQEWKGVGAPLWRNFGAIVGLDVPDRLGFFLAFTVFLTLALFVVGFIGIMGPLGPRWSAGALGALIGARLSDTLVSHVLLHGVGYRPNPGLPSTHLYVLEALFIGWFFQASLAADPHSAILGFAAGVLFFVWVLPLLWWHDWLSRLGRNPPGRLANRFHHGRQRILSPNSVGPTKTAMSMRSTDLSASWLVMPKLSPGR